MQHNRKHQIQELVTFLSRERAQTMPDAVTLSVISGSSFLALTRLSDSAANAITSAVRFFL